jgi:hypothetical protein
MSNRNAYLILDDLYHIEYRRDGRHGPPDLQQYHLIDYLVAKLAKSFGKA